MPYYADTTTQCGWKSYVFRTSQKRVYPPGTAKMHMKKDKTSLELSSVLVKECWTLFELIWAMRKKILHSKDTIGAKMHNFLLPM